jgi:hypothetical protein
MRVKESLLIRQHTHTQWKYTVRIHSKDRDSKDGTGRVAATVVVMSHS